MPLRELSTHYHAKAEAVGAALEISKIFEMTTDENERTQNLTKPIQTISLENVCVSYDGKKDTLRSINTMISKGEKVAIVGASGAGKTTPYKYFAWVCIVHW